VTERSTDRIVIEDPGSPDAYEVSYTVKGTRDGHTDKEVVTDPSREDRSLSVPEKTDTASQSSTTR
jgi:hypothetical protein